LASKIGRQPEGNVSLNLKDKQNEIQGQSHRITPVLQRPLFAFSYIIFP
jgi:hypothetical protein